MEKDIRAKMIKRKKQIQRKRRIGLLCVTFLLIFGIFIFLYKTDNNKKDDYTSTVAGDKIKSGQWPENEQKKEEKLNEENQTNQLNMKKETSESTTSSGKTEIQDWRLALANYEHILPEDFEVELANIDKTRKFDARAIGELNEMMNDMKKANITNIWIQSSYRSIEEQTTLYNQHIQKYLNQGKTQEEAEKLTLEYLNKPGASDHNLGLAVDFNYVDNTFEKTKAFTWLTQNAENYGFVLRYPKDKYDITKITYESWHWRYVGKEHAKKMNELKMCLEEYVEYLEDGKALV